MDILVTGASGLLGSHLCRQLVERGHTVRALVRQPLEHPLLKGLPIQQHRGDILDSVSLAAALTGCDSVFHAAGFISYLDRESQQCFSVNVEGTRTLLAAAARCRVRRCVYTSSTAAVGIPRAPTEPLDESGDFEAKYRGVAYMASKHDAEQVVREFEGIESMIVNPSTIFGAGDVKMNTGAMFRRLQQRQLRSIPPGGNACVSVSDCAAGHLLAWEKGRPGRRYILSEGNYSFAEIFKTAAAQLQVPPPVRRLPRWLYPLAYGACWLHDQTWARWVETGVSRHMIMIGFKHRYFEARRAREELGWAPTQNLEQMFAEAIAFYRDEGLL